ncbi:Fe-S cluster assembly protein HesB [Candidatus Gottesmanbacteria bacterium]|nr:Fe-S cluster assembly protein HesB [Candidatus Gottesmanbacteria bacterium]
MKLSQKQIKKFQNVIFFWWDKNKRDLPWRRTHDPYHIFISEIMLQQTQVSRVLPKYQEFLDLFPTVFALAQASPDRVLRVWKGMGYNRRALYLLKTAQIICNEYNGHFPKSYEVLIKLPGLGIYTARAILVFAYKKNIAMVDTNIRQIITHFFFEDIPQQGSVIQSVADQLVPKAKSWEWHQALMDYGSLELNVSRVMGQVSQKKIIPFRESNRFYRGRIIDQLRQGNTSRNALIVDFQKRYGKSRAFLSVMIHELERDGLLALFGRGIIGLPQE